MIVRTVVIATAALALMSGCATKRYVDEQDAGINLRIDNLKTETNASIAKTNSNLDALTARVNANEAKLGDVDRTAQRALGLAESATKFAYETTLAGDTTFRSGSAILTPAAKQKLDEIAAQIKGETRNMYIEIQGHTDSLGSDANNLRLGQARADAVRDYLAKQHDFPLHRMNVISYGASKPVASNRTAAGRAENRRVTIVIRH